MFRSTVSSRFLVLVSVAVAIGAGSAGATSELTAGEGATCNNVKCDGDTCTGTGGLGYACLQGWVISDDQGCQGEVETSRPCCFGVGCSPD